MPPLPVFPVQTAAPAYRKPPGRLHLPQAQRSLRKLSLPGRQSPPGRLPAQKLPCFPRLLLPAHRSPPRPLPLPGRQSSPQQSPFPDPWYLPPRLPRLQASPRRSLPPLFWSLFRFPCPRPPLPPLCFLDHVSLRLYFHHTFPLPGRRSLPASQQRPP